MTEALSDTQGAIVGGKYLNGASAEHKTENPPNLLNSWRL